jgi:hypothetical protein
LRSQIFHPVYSYFLYILPMGVANVFDIIKCNVLDQI